MPAMDPKHCLQALKGGEDVLCRTALSELLQLPSARPFPALAAVKRGQASAAAVACDAPAPCDVPVPPAPLIMAGRKGASPSADPTRLLLMEAANQLDQLVQAQLHRRMQRRVVGSRGGAKPGPGSDSDSDDDGCAASASPRSMAASVAGTSTAGTSRTTTEPVSQAASAPGTAPISLARCKRLSLERSYAIDLDGLCVVEGSRVPLPAADCTQLLEAAQGGQKRRAAP